MAINFGDMMDDENDLVINPRDIFFTLNRGATFSFPRDIQTEVMNLWFNARNNKDNIVKLNVGSGKTLIGLLILQSSLNEGIGPALYVAPDKQLVHQVLDEAQRLGLDVIDDPRDPGYASGDKICVINIYKLFNGRSVFGVDDEGQKIRIGSVIIDDAHACISTITKQFRVKISNLHEAYGEILSAFGSHLSAYNEAKYLDILNADPLALMEVPFWVWQNYSSDILRILNKYKESDDLRFTYPFLKEILPFCRCFISGQNIEIEALFPAADLINSFRKAKRRIYMTATLSDDSVIATHFNASPEKLVSPLIPISSQSMGERMILMPQELNPDLGMEEIKQLLRHLANSENVVVIVPSTQTSLLWHDVANQTLQGDNVVEGIKKLKNGHIGLTVLVNRYDGIDLPGNACRVLALVDLPEVASYMEVSDETVLDNSSLGLKRQIERIEQGMGRGVRSNDDYCAVLLVGSKLTARVRSKGAEKFLTPATKAQLELSRKIAKQLGTPSIKEIIDVVNQCLNRDPDWIKFSKKALINLVADNNLNFDNAKLALKTAMDLARSNQFDQAIKVLSEAVNQSVEDEEKAWLLFNKAAFQHHLDAEGAQKALSKAHSLERSVMKPLQGISYKKISAVNHKQAKALINYHSQRFVDSVAMNLHAGVLCSDLNFDENISSNKFEAAVNDLASFLGIVGHRPENEFNEGPDNLWASSAGSFFVIECKNRVTSNNGISKHDAGQLEQSLSWFRGKYPSSSFFPIIIHPMNTLDAGASAIEGMRCINNEKLGELRKSLMQFSKELMNVDVSSSVQEISKRLVQYRFSSESFVGAYTVAVKSN